MDFFDVKTNVKYKPQTETTEIEVYPDFKVDHKVKDLMVQGREFYAVWNKESGLWSRNSTDVVELVDKELYSEAERLKNEHTKVKVKTMRNYSSGTWTNFNKYVKEFPDNAIDLDRKVTFLNSEVKRSDRVSKRLNYDMSPGDHSAFDELIFTLYDPEEAKKLIWAIGAIISGESRKLQKFIVLYGEAGSGKSTVINIFEKLFDGYYGVFDSEELGSKSAQFSLTAFESNPILAIQHDGDLSRIETNTRLNSIISHEEMLINVKHKHQYTMRPTSFLVMATNKPVRITDSKSGLIRRLIDVKPSGRLFPYDRYLELTEKIDYELGAIADYCYNEFMQMGASYYNSYRPTDMMYDTDPFFNFVENSYDVFDEQDYISLRQAWAMYKEYVAEACLSYSLKMYQFRSELKDYFRNYYEEFRAPDGNHIRNCYSGFKKEKFASRFEPTEKVVKNALDLKVRKSLFDDICGKCQAQYASSQETPLRKWEDVETKLEELDTSKLHYVRVPENHIVIDFDIHDDSGNKSLEKNIEAASKWPPTYAELSKGGNGIHLHYIYKGDPTQLSRVYADCIEIKVFTGLSSLRRKLSKCNDLPIAEISSGLPLKMKGAKMVDEETIKDEKHLRSIIKKVLRKETNIPGTKPSIDFIEKILNDAYTSGMNYDVSNLRSSIFTFAAQSTHHSEYCQRVVGKMKFKSEDVEIAGIEESKDDSIIFYDIEVFPNLLLVNWKKEGPGHKVVRMINPSPAEIENLITRKLVGFNCRRYDNHILWARMMGYNNEQLYKLSQQIINNSSGFFGNAYNLSYADIYDFSSKKQSLKKFEIELGIHHQELGLPWDQPVPEDKWVEVAEYCDNDVIATEAVWNDRQQDFVARQILSDLSGLKVNDTTRMHTTKIIFGEEKHPILEYTDLSELFPGYEFVLGEDNKMHNMYMGEDVGFGGYVYAEPGMYSNVAVLDAASMHPSSIMAMNCFGDYTPKFGDILKARIFIKHKEFDKAKQLMGGAFAPYLKDEKQAKDLAQALKIVINSVYGYTTATFDNPFKDPRNVNNIVALRGALFMVTLKHKVQEMGYQVVHIKTDSIKVPNATPEIINYIQEFGKQYGYNLEHEATYDRMCLVNQAVLIARYKDPNPGKWSAVGAQFQHPYVFKKLFTHEQIIFDDLCETKSVTGGALYLDMNEDLFEDEHSYHFVGKIGEFCPMLPGAKGGVLYREKDGKYYAATGTKGYRWLESETVKALNKEDAIDYGYFNKLVDEAAEEISKYGDFERFTADEPFVDLPF